VIDIARRDAVAAQARERRVEAGWSADRLLGWLVPALLLALVVAGWEAYVWIDDTPAWFLPSPSAIAEETVSSRALLWEHTWTTLQEVIAGYLIALAVGIVTALLIAISPIAERTVYPVIVASQAIPIVALAPILLIWFGFGMTPKIIVVVLLCYFPIAVNMADGLRAADPDAVNLLRSMGAGRRQVMRLVRVPSSLPYLISGARVAAAVSVIGAIVGEWAGASSGLGYLMTRAASQFLTARLFATVAISAVIGIALFALVALIGRVLVPWSKDQGTGNRE
jgi:ABC-type nitrate/sulfonate/bicarbonate transport system permease component